VGQRVGDGSLNELLGLARERSVGCEEFVEAFQRVVKAGTSDPMAAAPNRATPARLSRSTQRPVEQIADVREQHARRPAPPPA
jgi:hypothetical protein